MIEKNAMIAICGRPNVGKSTLTNRLVGEKVSIVSAKPQTTRTRITAVTERGGTQFVFLDTPGFHKPRTRLGDYMVGIVRQSVSNVDAAVLMVEPIDSMGPQEEALIAGFRENGVPAVLAINKIDTVPPSSLLPVIKVYAEAFPFAAIIPISAKKGGGVEELLSELQKFALPGPQLFPDGMSSEQPDRQICAELLREKLLLCLDKEIPHGTAVEVTTFSEREDGLIDVEATIYCEKEGHKRIIIGKNGSMLRRVGELARKDIEEFMGAKVCLKTWVKVRENWRDSRIQLRNLGFRE
jgi:GTP-binding protein Era